jgi:transcriptional regulator with XRE-family HTH domain
MRGRESIAATVSSAQELLAVLRKRLDEPISWEVKRRIVEILVAGIRIDTYEECGVKLAKTTVTYRFSQPEQAMPLILSQSYAGGGRVVRIPVNPKTIGDHIRRQRLTRKMLQKDVAKLMGVDKQCVETNKSTPEVRYVPAIIDFLGYNPLPPSNGIGEELVRQRTTLGLSQKQAAARMQVDPTTLARWEHGEKEPWGKIVDRVRTFLTARSSPRSERDVA